MVVELNQWIQVGSTAFLLYVSQNIKQINVKKATVLKDRGSRVPFPAGA
jgi:hypothetical protein